jgi:hypothetical protein
MNIGVRVFNGGLLAVVLCAVSVLTAPSTVMAAETTVGEPSMPAMDERCRLLREQRVRLQQDLQAQDTELAERVVLMNRAGADIKLTLMAEVVTRLVAQRLAIHARQERFEDEVMRHIMQHLQEGRAAMANCPMMAVPPLPTTSAAAPAAMDPSQPAVK